MVEVTRVDFAAKRLETSAGPIASIFSFSRLGARTNFFGLESMQRHGLGLKDIPDAIAIRKSRADVLRTGNARARCQRRRALLTFIVVGGGRPASRWPVRCRS